MTETFVGIDIFSLSEEHNFFQDQNFTNLTLPQNYVQLLCSIPSMSILSS